MKETKKMQMVNVRAMWMACALVVAGLVGCAENTQIYESTENYPMSIDLVDVRSKEVVWTMDIPVRHKLELEFWHETGIATKWQPPTKVVYRLYPSSKFRKMSYESSLPLDVPVLIKMRMRPAPEYAMPGMINGQPIIYNDQQPVEPVADEPAPAVAPAPAEQPAAVEAVPAPAVEAAPEPAVEEPAAVEPATIEAADAPEPEAAEPESDAKQEEPTEVVEPAAVQPQAAEPAAPPVTDEPAAAEAEPEPEKPQSEDKWALPSIDPDPAQKNDKEYPALDD